MKTPTHDFDKTRQKWFDAACSKIDRQRLTELIAGLVNIHSPTGNERAATDFLAAYMKDIGLNGIQQKIGDNSGNCYGNIPGNRNGPNLMLYAPIDTHLEADEPGDIPWVGPSLRADMKPVAEIRDDLVIGLGASNPKSMIASLVEAAHCIRLADIPLSGELSIASCGGGMPWIVSGRNKVGLSSGVTQLLNTVPKPDYGLILKPSDEVYYEHPGLAWFRITVWGSLGYAGLPRGIPGFRSPIIPAGKIINTLEDWLIDYADTHSTEQVRPEGWISALQSGWPDKPAFPAAACEIYIDIRTNPNQSKEDIQTEFDEIMQKIVSQDNDINITWEMYAYCQASRTEPGNWIVQSALKGWENIHSKPYPGATPTSGQTDAATICALGVPLARIGYPFPATDTPAEFSEGLGGMGVARISELINAIRHIIYVAIDTCTRTCEETGLEKIKQ